MSKKNLVKIFIILCFVLSPFVLNYIKLEQLIAAPTAHKHNDWTYIPSNKSGFPYSPRIAHDLRCYCDCRNYFICCMQRS